MLSFESRDGSEIRASFIKIPISTYDKLFMVEDGGGYIGWSSWPIHTKKY